MTFNDLTSLAGPLSILVALTIGLVEALKRSVPDVDNRILPTAAIGFGWLVCLAAYWSFGTLELRTVPLTGIVVGLAAIGLFSGSRATLGK